MKQRAVVELSIRDVRAALEAVSTDDDRGRGEPSTALLGSLFHRVHAALVGPDPETNAATFLLGIERDLAAWRAQIVDHTYDRILGPALQERRAALQGSSSAVLRLWTATRELARWIADLVWASRSATDGAPSRIQLLAEHELRCELREPTWSAPVRITGIADSLVRTPSSFCAVELKLGRARPAVDLGQAALYRLVASHLAESPTREDALAVVWFEPAKREVLYRRDELVDAERRLLRLIGELAGVAGPDLAGAESAAPQDKASAAAKQPAAKVPVTKVPAAKASAAKVSASEAPEEKMPAERATSAPEPAPAAAITAAHRELGESLRAAFRAYGAQFDFAGDPQIGPRFIRFPFALRTPTMLAALERCKVEVGLRLGVEPPILSRANHRPGIDVQRPDPVAVPFQSVVRALEAQRTPTGSASLLVGVDIAGRTRSIDLSDPSLPHVLVAGTTGSGKTEWLRMALASLALVNTPRTLRFVLVDPKQTAFGELAASPFLRDARSFSTPSGCDEVIGLLEDLANEMERRYVQLREAGVDDLGMLAARTDAAPPRIVFVCDEYFALASQAGASERRELERLIGILGAKARAAGIHLVLALQQASRKILSGAIDGNIPARVALRTQKAEDSRMVLGHGGAEHLTGKGDLLFRGTGETERLQAPLIDAATRAAIFSAEG